MIEMVKITDNLKPNFVKSYLMEYKQDDKIKTWEVVDVHDSVAILLFHKEKNAFVLVKQFRPAVYMKNRDGFTYELCAGLVDKDKFLVQIAKEEILEECGFDVPPESIREITEFYTSVGFAGGKQSMFFCEVSEDQKVNQGGGIGDEQIEVLYLPIKEANSFMFDKSKVKTPGLLFSFLWYFSNY